MQRYYGTSGIKITALEQAKRRKQVHEPILNDPKFEILLNQLQMKKL
jgi:O-glycosyl hydrolase